MELLGITLIVLGVALAVPPSRRVVLHKLPFLTFATKKWWLPILIILVGGGQITLVQNERGAASGGFPNTETYQEAKRKNITTYEEYKKFLEKEKERIAAEKAAAAELAAKKQAEAKALAAQKEAEAKALAAQKEAEEKAELQKNINNAEWLHNKYSYKAIYPCQKAVEKLAKYDFEWTDGFLESKFDSYATKTPQPGVIRIFGDKIKFQNGFSAWQRVKYSCDYNVLTGQVYASATTQ